MWSKCSVSNSSVNKPLRLRTTSLGRLWPGYRHVPTPGEQVCHPPGWWSTLLWNVILSRSRNTSLTQPQCQQIQTTMSRGPGSRPPTCGGGLSDGGGPAELAPSSEQLNKTDSLESCFCDPALSPLTQQQHGSVDSQVWKVQGGHTGFYTALGWNGNMQNLNPHCRQTLMQDQSSHRMVMKNSEL